VAEWIDLVDPDEETLRAKAPPGLHPRALTRLLAHAQHDDEPRPTLEEHDGYVFAIFLVAVVLPEENRVYNQEVDAVLTKDTLLTVSKTEAGEQPFDPGPAKSACKSHEPASLFLFRLADDIAERYLDLVDALNDEIDELEDQVETTAATEVRARISDLRHDLLRIRRTVTPTRDAVHRVVDGRIGEELIDRDVQLHFADAYDKLLRATEGLELSRDLLAGVRDYAQAKIANDQNEVMKRLTAVASILLLPTFIVGLYGQNFEHIPELDWAFGYWWSWGWIIATTIAQLVFYRRKRWI
jgi:magnesium transporter